MEHYPKIADKISRFVNKNKCFPDFEDILNIVRVCSCGTDADSLEYVVYEWFLLIANMLDSVTLSVCKEATVTCYEINAQSVTLQM